MGWQLIESQSLSSSAASVTFSNIPQTYKSIKILVSVRGTADTANSRVTFNGSTANVSDRVLFGNGLVGGSFSDASILYSLQNRSTSTTNTFANFEVTVPNYSSTTQNKAVSIDAVDENNGSAANQYLVAGLFSSTSAVTSATVSPNSGNFDFGSTFTLYGLA